LRLLGALALVPPGVSTLSAIGLWIWGFLYVLWRISGLRTKLLWRIRRKLVISYLLIGLVPTLLILFFFLLSSFFIVGQVSSYVLNSEIQRLSAVAVQIADLTLSDLQGMRATRSHLPDEAIQKALEKRLASADRAFPRTAAVYLEHRRGRLQRVVAAGEIAGVPQVGTSLPDWIHSAYSGPILTATASYLGGISQTSPGSDSAPPQEGLTVLVVSPIEAALDGAAERMGFHIDQVVTSLSGRTPERSALLLDARETNGQARGDAGKTSPFTFPWLTALPSRSLGENREADTDLIFVQFGFSPVTLYDGIAANALQLGPDGPDLGKLILWALALLAGLFLVIEVSAIFVGLVLARSITGSVHALSQGTEHVRQGDFGYKVHVRSRDQLGELADSFNLMTTSIEDLLRESAEKERLEEELRVARTIQMNLLPPKERMTFPGLSIAPLCLPATEVGGDYYDCLPLGDGRLALLIADVSGKGTSAALYMAELKGLILSLSRVYSSPRSLLIEANEILAANLDSRSFITMAYAIIDMNERRMTYARAGHNPIFHIPANGVGRKTRVLAPEGLGLALDRGGSFERILEEDSVALESGDFFLFFTDGISEAMNDRSELFGEDRLRILLEENADLQMEELREKLVDEVFSFAGGAVQHDDMTMVLVKVL
jgi:serine phosphatase RsbU (regulator of sigma subunit)